MTLSRRKKILQSAEKICASQGARFTPKRKEVFNTMLLERKALSAYEIAEKIRSRNPVPQPVVSVYRTLDFLEKKHLVHKLASINKYSVCAHIICDHQHAMPRIAICTKCHTVDEIPASHIVEKHLKKDLQGIHFHLKSEHIELTGLCHTCYSKEKT